MTDVKAAFNQQLKNKVAGKPVEEKASPEEVVERAGAALEELTAAFSELAELAGVSKEEEAPEEEKTK